MSISEQTIIISSKLDSQFIAHSNLLDWKDFLDEASFEIIFDSLPFDHPLYIVYSSGTTGKPKSIVHSAGGTLIQHIKELQLHTDISDKDTIFYYTTCGWMMWNWLISSLSLGATIILYDGSPFFGNGNILINMIDELKITVFGTSAKYISALESKNIIPKALSKFPSLRTILSTGSPLIDKNFNFVYSSWKKDVQLSSISGGTDIISCFALGNPILPVHCGEIQSIGLGMKVESLDNNGKKLINKKGELVCSSAFPSMPIYFWNDTKNKKYHAAYFERYNKIWCQGDFAMITKSRGMVIHGRSDTVLNPGGVRIGTADIYSQVEKFDQVIESIVIGQNWDYDVRIILFLVLRDDEVLTKDLKDTICDVIRENTTPKHVPSKIIQVKEIPRTRSGKIVELAVKKAVQGEVVDNTSAIANPECLEYFKNLTELENRNE